MFFKRIKKDVKKGIDQTAKVAEESIREIEEFKERESLEKKALKSLSDEELAKAIRTVLRKSKLS